MEDRQIQFLTLVFRIDEFLEIRRPGEQRGGNLFFQRNRLENRLQQIDLAGRFRLRSFSFRGLGPVCFCLL